MTKTNQSISELIDFTGEFFDSLVEFREELHRNPELSWQEFQTTTRIKSFLSQHGIDQFASPLETGGIVDFKFKENAPFILLRADIDALPLQDEKNTPYCSQNPGVCHACAHDAHTAVMAGVAIALNKVKPPLPCNLRFVFQPAEEPIPSGAPEMIKKGVLNNVRYVLGLHMEPRLPLGTISLTPGWINMQSNRLDLTLNGPGGHSARPHETADLLWIASRIIQDSYQIVYRELNLLDSAVILTFTAIEAGQGYNVIPNQLKLTGTLRLSDEKKKADFLTRFKKLLAHYESETGCQIQFTIQHGSPAIYNDPELIEKLKSVLQNKFELPFKLVSNFRTPGGDDFSYYCKDIPGAMVKIGVRTDQMTASLHEGKFDVPPESIKNAVLFFLHQIVYWDEI